MKEEEVSVYVSEGRDAYLSGRQEVHCPYYRFTYELGRRCAWLAGYRDAKRESGK